MAALTPQMDTADAFLPPLPRQHLLALFHETFKQGTRGMIADSRILTRDWGFNLADIAYDKVQIWHGSKDINAPVRAVRWMADRLPGAELIEYDVDHFAMGTLVEEVLDGLITEQMRREVSDGRTGRA